jgi:hypothetical protein
VADKWVALSEVKTYFKVSDDNSNNRIDRCIELAQAAIEQQLLQAGQVYGTFTDVVEYLRANDYQDAIFLQEHISLTTLTHVKENGTALTENSDFYCDKSIGKFTKASGYWSTTPRSIEIKYSLTKAAPTDLKLALIEYTGVLAGIKTSTYMTREGVEATVDQGLPDFVKDVIESHRIPREAMING